MADLVRIVVEAAIEAYRERVLALCVGDDTRADHLAQILANEPTVEDVLARATPRAKAAQAEERAQAPKGNRRERRARAAAARRRRAA